MYSPVAIKIDDLAKAVGAELEAYADEIAQTVKSSVEEVAQETVRDVKRRSPVDRGDYRKSWTRTTVRETLHSIVISVYNRKHYRLTHLLENGHALVNGGRTKAQPHIAPAERDAERTLLQKVQEDIREVSQ